MDPVMGGIAAAFAIVAIVLFLQVMKQSGALAQLKKTLDESQKELKKTSQQLSQKVEKYNKKAQQASKNKHASKDQKSRIASLQDELHTSKAELSKSKDKVKTFSSEVNRLRIEREELRQALAASKRSAPEYAEPAVQEVVSAPASASDSEEAKSEAAPKRQSPKSSISRLERDLERVQKDLEKAAGANKRLKRSLVETTAKYRAVSRKNEHNRRAYVITQLQLDLLQDENYTLKHGSPPPEPQANKAAKRQALLPQEEALVIDRDAAPIQLPSAEELDAAEAAPSAAIIERAADRVEEVEPELEVEESEETIVEASDVAEAAAEVEAIIEAEAEAEPEPEPEVLAESAEAQQDRPEPPDASVKRRRKVKTEDGVAAKAAAPPRPTN